MNYPPGEEIKRFKFIVAQVNKVAYLNILASDELRAYETAREQTEREITEKDWVEPPEDLKTVFFQYEDEIDLGEI